MINSYWLIATKKGYIQTFHQSYDSNQEGYDSNQEGYDSNQEANDTN